MVARLRSLLSRLRRRGVFEHNLDEELRFHLAARAEDLERRGVSREAARRQATLELGGAERARIAARSRPENEYVELGHFPILALFAAALARRPGGAPRPPADWFP